MISYRDVGSLDGATQAEVEALLERSRAITRTPEDRAQVAAWERLAADCERIGFPHLTTTARLSQYHLLSNGGETSEAIAAFVRLMQVVHRHRDLIDPRKTEIVLGEISTAVITAVEDPTVPVERIEKMIDLVDQEVRLQGTDRAGVHIARAALSCSRGDARGTREWLERYRAEGSEGWRADEPSVLQIDVPLLARFDPAGADEVLVRGARANGLALDRAGEAPIGDDSIALWVLHAFLLRRQGRTAEADRIADVLLAARPAAGLAREAPPEQLVPVLENHPEAALVVVDHTLRNVLFDGTTWEVIAALARDRVRADPDGLEGGLLRRLADESAAAQDARGATRVHASELADFWWAGLPDAGPGTDPRPIDPHRWGNPDARAELILAAGWLDRAGWLSFHDAPRALSPRYRQLLEDSMELISAGDDAEADALAERLRAEGERLHCAATRVNVPLFRGARDADHGDIEGLVTGCLQAQAEFLAVHESLPDFVPQSLDGLMRATAQLAVSEPGIGWQRIEELISAQQRIVAETGRTPATSLQLAHLEIAAHLGQGDKVREQAEVVLATLAEESRQVDAVNVLLTVVRLTAEQAPDIAEAVARNAAAAGDEVQSRAGTAWLCWFAHRRGAPGAAEELRRVVDSVGGDVEALGPVPGWVVLDVVAPTGGDLPGLVEALLTDAEPLSGESLGLLVSAGAVLRDQAPADPRSREFQDRAVAITRGLDERNGDTRWSTWLEQRQVRVGSVEARR
ncbi:hypothetical protein [Streptomyces sp. AD55]|uniref:hypothetical protein n=1 Tax=Streptomyces sp. AD55 TaxID=3242895 RepID=UPI003528D81C